jgi:hypothetical protein
VAVYFFDGVDVLMLWSESKSHDIVTAGHTLDAVSLDVCMWLIGIHDEAITSSTSKIIEQK